MLNIVKLSNHDTGYSEKMLPQLFMFMNDIYKDFYPNFQEWFFDKVATNYKIGKRSIYIVKNLDTDNIYGAAILKNTCQMSRPNKICSFFLLSEARKCGLGAELMNNIFHELRYNTYNRRVIITVPEERAHINRKNTDSMTSFLDSFGFCATKAVRGRYRSGMLEYVFEKNLRESCVYES